MVRIFILVPIETHDSVGLFRENDPIIGPLREDGGRYLLQLAPAHQIKICLPTGAALQANLGKVMVIFFWMVILPR